jgi:hypothetical protein
MPAAPSPGACCPPPEGAEGGRGRGLSRPSQPVWIRQRASDGRRRETPGRIRVQRKKRQEARAAPAASGSRRPLGAGPARQGDMARTGARSTSPDPGRGVLGRGPGASADQEAVLSASTLAAGPSSALPAEMRRISGRLHSARSTFSMVEAAGLLPSVIFRLPVSSRSATGMRAQPIQRISRGEKPCRGIPEFWVPTSRIGPSRSTRRPIAGRHADRPQRTRIERL